jgi:hypothetical protein
VPIVKSNPTNLDLEVVLFTFILLENEEFTTPDAVELLLAGEDEWAYCAVSRPLCMRE